MAEPSTSSLEQAHATIKAAGDSIFEATKLSIEDMSAKTAYSLGLAYAKIEVALAMLGSDIIVARRRRQSVVDPNEGKWLTGG
jgi:hypothetical protein